MSNYTGALFSHNGGNPDFLPYRLRLPSRETRYIDNISLSEIHSCGYTGPIEVPETTDGQCVVWSSETQQFTVENISQSFYDENTNYICRSQLKDLLAKRDSSLRSQLTQEGRVKYDNYYSQILDLLGSTELLTEDQLPVLSLDILDYEAELTAFVNQMVRSDKNLERMQYNYEYLGRPPESTEDNLSVLTQQINNFEIPASWVASGSLSAEQIQFWQSKQNEQGYLID